MVNKKKNEIIEENKISNKFAYHSLRLTDRYHLVSKDEKVDNERV
jgi:hypothetical protein